MGVPLETVRTPGVTRKLSKELKQKARDEYATLAAEIQFYLGPAGSGAPAHYHGHAVNSLAYGEKVAFLDSNCSSMEVSYMHYDFFILLSEMASLSSFKCSVQHKAVNSSHALRCLLCRYFISFISLLYGILSCEHYAMYPVRRRCHVRATAVWTRYC